MVPDAEVHEQSIILTPLIGSQQQRDRRRRQAEASSVSTQSMRAAITVSSTTFLIGVSL
jgi:hypothetical protein